MRNFDLRALQMCELEILKEFIRICDKYQLKYYLAWGTLLGAVRHQGFIPWDDDIDVCMFYDDYLKFKEICKTELHPDFFYEDREAHSEYFLYWAKLRKNNTTCMTRSEKDLNIHWGVGIDIFPLVKMDTKECTKVKKAAKSALNLFVQRAYLPYSSNELSKKIKKIIYAIVPPSWDKKIIKKCFDILNKSGKDATYVWDFSEAAYKSMFPLEIFGEGEWLEFEGITMNCPENFPYYLEKVYGEDYMVLPKEEDRVNHGDIIVDLEKSYTYYQ